MIIQLKLVIFIFLFIKCNTINITDIIDDSKYKDCIHYYFKYIQPNQNKNNEVVSFEEYIDYWWDLEEKKEDLIDKICKNIILKYKKRFLRNKNMY